jgi:acyl carrier protein
MLSRDELRTVLVNLLEEEIGMPVPTLDDDQDIREALGLDSVDIVGLVMRIERRFRVRLSTDEMMRVKQVRDLLDLMELKQREIGELPSDVAAQLAESTVRRS